MGRESRKKKNYEKLILGMYRQNDSLFFANDDQNIAMTNFWDSEIAMNGHFYVSINAGAIRLLLPKQLEWCIDEIKTGSYMVLSQSTNDIELMFEDNSDSPFSLWAPIVFIDRLSSKSRMEGLRFSVWTCGCNKVLEMSANVRQVSRVPCLEKW